MPLSCALAIFAHPDDESLLAGGTLAALAARGMDVVVVSATRGEEGPIAWPGLATPATLGAVRELELQTACRALGVEWVECLDFADGELSWIDQDQLQAALEQTLRRWRPDVVITFGPEGFYWHPDHIAIHTFTLAALDILAAEGCLPWVYYATWPEGRMQELVTAMEARGLVVDLWGIHPDAFGAPAESITTTLDIRPYLWQKQAALLSHRSQIGAAHVFRVIPDDLATEYLGHESFVLARPDGSTADWLAEVVATSRACCEVRGTAQHCVQRSTATPPEIC